MAPVPPLTEKKRTRLLIQGMTCTACAARVQNAFLELEGVEAANVNFASATSLIWHSQKVDTPTMVAMVTDLGFQAVEDGDRQQIQSSTESALKKKTLPAMIIALFAMITMFVQFPGSEWAVAALSTICVWWCGWIFHRAARLQILQKSLAMDTLISLGTLAAWSWSIAVLIFSADQSLHFGGANAIVAFVLLGKWWEARAIRTSGDALRALTDLTPKQARLRDGRELPIEELKVGMAFITAPGERVATDGRIIEGRSEVDASQATGESMPIEVSPGSTVSGGVLNGPESLVIEATAVGEDTELSRVARLVEDAQATQAPIQRTADLVAARFVPLVILLALGSLAVRWGIGHQLSDALIAAVAVLVVSCPCSFGLATPLAVLVGTGRAAQLGVVVAGAHVLDSTRVIDTVVFDKTGTLTTGHPVIVNISSTAENQALLLSQAAALESRSGHPIARAFEPFIEEAAEIDDFTNHLGQGISGKVNGIEVRAGKADLFGEIPSDLRDLDFQGTTLFIGRGSTAEASVSIRDEIRPTSREAVSLLTDMGLEVILLSGDTQQVAQRVADQLNIETVLAEVLPDQKRDHIAALQSAGKCVAMVGDGINDTPALATADLGIALQAGTDAARNAADLTIMTNDPRAVADGISLSRRTLRTVKGNLSWAFSYNAIALPLAVTGYLSPTYAAIAMAFSSFLVVANSLRLRYFNSIKTATSLAPDIKVDLAHQ
ncbi:MAG TPA: cadmium-translocating P-type ATPase [Acidimicrobiaceae bacterium]|nr:cadmium-translocating P-type ATPase [Acidimicrobiaceae bacterium]